MPRALPSSADRGSLQAMHVLHGLLLLALGCSKNVCEATDDCKTLGHCTPEDGQCIIKDSADCRKSTGCTNEGACTLKTTPTPGGAFARCINAGSAEDCKKSAWCKARGACSLNASQTQCEVGSDGDCAQSDLCRTDHKCFDNGGLCSQTR